MTCQGQLAVRYVLRLLLDLICWRHRPCPSCVYENRERLSMRPTLAPAVLPGGGVEVLKLLRLAAGCLDLVVVVTIQWLRTRRGALMYVLNGCVRSTIWRRACIKPQNVREILRQYNHESRLWKLLAAGPNNPRVNV